MNRNFSPTSIGMLTLVSVLVMFVATTELNAQLFSGKPRFMQLFERTAAPPAKYTQLPAQQKLIADINAVSTRIRQLDSRVTLAIPGSPKIHGQLQIEFPNRMRLKAGIMGMSEAGVDAGSNDNLFWVWTKVATPGQPPSMFYARHDTFQTSRFKQQLPFEPRWLIDALGILKLDPRGKHHGPFSDDAGRMWLYSVLDPGTQSQLTRALLINATSGIIEQVAIYNGQNKLVAWSNATQFQFDAEHNVSLPRKISLHMIQADGSPFQMTIDLKSHSYNSLHGDPKLMWEIPQATGVQWIDLGRQ